MEALLKLIVGVDGVTAGMLVQLGYMYLVIRVIVAATVLGVVMIIASAVRYGIDSVAKRHEAILEAKVKSKSTIY